MSPTNSMVMEISSDEEEEYCNSQQYHNHPKSLHLDDDDACVLLDNDPNELLLHNHHIDSSGDANDDSDDVLVVSEKGQVACRDYPHSRHLCIKFPFSTTPNQSHCNKCYCYVCDSLAPCLYWGNGTATTDHCHATDKDEFWITQRKNVKIGSPIAQPAPPPVHIPNLSLVHAPHTPANFQHPRSNPLTSRNILNPDLAYQALIRTHKRHNLGPTIHRPVFKRTGAVRVAAPSVIRVAPTAAVKVAAPGVVRVAPTGAPRVTSTGAVGVAQTCAVRAALTVAAARRDAARAARTVAVARRDTARMASTGAVGVASTGEVGVAQTGAVRVAQTVAAAQRDAAQAARTVAVARRDAARVASTGTVGVAQTVAAARRDAARAALTVAAARRDAARVTSTGVVTMAPTGAVRVARTVAAARRDAARVARTVAVARRDAARVARTVAAARRDEARVAQTANQNPTWGSFENVNRAIGSVQPNASVNQQPQVSNHSNFNLFPGTTRYQPIPPLPSIPQPVPPQPSYAHCKTVSDLTRNEAQDLKDSGARQGSTDNSSLVGDRQSSWPFDEPVEPRFGDYSLDSDFMETCPVFDFSAFGS